MRDIDAKGLHPKLEHVYWIGGGSGAGKSTVSRRLAARHQMSLYSTDEAISAHGRVMGEDAPLLRAFAAMEMDERWVQRSPATMLDTFHWFQGEGFDLIVEDLVTSPADRTLVEGFRLLPNLVLPLLPCRSRAVWLLPTQAFRRAAFEQRGTLWDIPRRTSDPDRALQNLLARDHGFTERLRVEIDRLGLCAIDVDFGLTQDELVDRVERAFGLEDR